VTNEDCASNPTYKVCSPLGGTCVECHTSADCKNPAKPNCGPLGYCM
jgi:hypothetical protein